MSGTEIWKTIPGHEAYQASSLGRVCRITGGRGARPGHVLTPKRHRDGYGMVDLSTGNSVTRMTIAHAVCLAFHGSPPTPDHLAAHGDGDCTNDRPGNVRWATQLENMADARSHGTLRLGSRHQNAKLDEAKVVEMRKRRAQGATFKELAGEFGVSPSNCHAAVTGRQWPHVTREVLR